MITSTYIIRHNLCKLQMFDAYNWRLLLFFVCHAFVATYLKSHEFTIFSQSDQHCGSTRVASRWKFVFAHVRYADDLLK